MQDKRNAEWSAPTKQRDARVYLEAGGEGGSAPTRCRATASDSDRERGSSDCERDEIGELGEHVGLEMHLDRSNRVYCNVMCVWTSMLWSLQIIRRWLGLVRVRAEAQAMSMCMRERRRDECRFRALAAGRAMCRFSRGPGRRRSPAASPPASYALISMT